MFLNHLSILNNDAKCYSLLIIIGNYSENNMDIDIPYGEKY